MSPSLGILGPVAIVVLGVMIGSGPAAGAGPGASAYKGVPPEPFIGGLSPEEEAAQQADLHRWLMREVPSGVLQAPLLVGLTEAERKDLARRQDTSAGPAVVGRTKLISEGVRFSDPDAALLSANPRRVGPGFLGATPDGGFVWAAAIASPGAAAIRVHLGGLRLPPDAEMFFFNRTGQAFGPYTGAGPHGSGEFWTNTVFGSEGVILLRHYGPDGAADLKRTSFVIQDVGHIGAKLAEGLGISPESFCSFNVPCIENASCFSGTPAQPAKSAVALMQWIQGAFIYTCTGGLIADSDGASQIPYFLTANHCLSSNSVAQNLEAYFQFSLACGSTSCPAQTNPGGIQRLGATVMATGTAGDFTLLRLNQAPPGGSVFLGWNNTPVANTNGAALYRISHPAWAPQAYSADTVSTSAPTCTGWPRGQRIYSRTTTGGTEGGSSGSPVVNASSQIVGQLSGACGTNVNNACDHVNNATVDGAFAYYWPSVEPYLGTACVPTTEVCNDGIDNDCDTAIDCADSNCAGSPSCPSCAPVGGGCVLNSDCCSNKCKGRSGAKTCK
jgi:hypothetical protein